MPIQCDGVSKIPPSGVVTKIDRGYSERLDVNAGDKRSFVCDITNRVGPSGSRMRLERRGCEGFEPDASGSGTYPPAGSQGLFT